MECSASVIAVHGLSCSEACGILLPQPEVEPASLAVQGGFLTTGPQRSPLYCFYKEDFQKSSLYYYSVSHSVVSGSLWPHELQPARLLYPRDFPGKNTGVGAISFFRGSSWPRDRAWVSYIGPQILYCLSHRGSPLTIIEIYSSFKSMFLYCWYKYFSLCLFPFRYPWDSICELTHSRANQELL